MNTRWMWGVGGAILIFLVAFALDMYPGLRGGAGWDWTYELPQAWDAVAILAAVLIVYLLGGWLLHKQAVRWTLLWAFVGAAVITYAVVSVRGDVGFLLFTRTVSPVQTGAISLAVREFSSDGVIPAMRRWTQIMNDAYDANLIHFTTSPPGQALVHYGIAQVFDSPPFAPVSQPLSRNLRPYQCSDLNVMTYTRGEIISAGFGLLLPILAALGVFPLYLVARDLTHDLQAAKQISLWWGLVPSLALFAPTWNTVYPALCVGSFALLARGVLQQRTLLVLLSGVVMSATTFLNFAVLPILLLFGVFTLGCMLTGCMLTTITEDEPPGRKARRELWSISASRIPHPASLLDAVVVGIWYGIGLLSVWVTFALVSGLTPLDLLQITFSSHRDLVQREYLPWLILHLYDTALFMGLPLVTLAVLGMVQAFRHPQPNPSPSNADEARQDPLVILALALLIMIFVLNFSGIVQGENGRILSFYAPFLLLAGLINHKTPESRAQASQLLPLLQALTLWVMATVLSTIPLDLNPQPRAPRTDIGGFGDSPALIVSDAQFEGVAYSGAFGLTGYRYIGDPSAQAISFEFNWMGQLPTERPYYFELVASAFNDIDGKITVEPFRWQPQNGNYLTTCWRSGDAIRDVVVLRLPPVAKPVVWEVELRAVDERTSEVMRVSGAKAAADGQSLALEPVKYP